MAISSGADSFNRSQLFIGLLRNGIYILLLILSIRSGSRAQALISDSSVTISVTASSPCRAFGDTSDLGTTPATWNTEHPGLHILRLVPTSAASEKEWGTPAIVETLTVRAGDRLEKNYQIPVLYHIASEPYGADVYLHDSLVAHTPCAISIEGSNKYIRLESAGFENSELPLDPSQTSVHVVLSPSGATHMHSDALAHPESVSNTPLHLIGATTVITGIVAATCKIKADNLYGDYRSTGDPSVVHSVHTYDTISGISLAATQCGLILLSYLLLSR